MFLNTASNGLDALRAIGVDLAERADSVPIPRMVMWSGRGKRLGEVANGVELPDGTVSVCVKRGLLQRVLREEATARGCGIEFGKRLERYETGPHGVVAYFADGTRAEGEFLVGADGIHSRTRRILNPDAPAPRYTGLISVGGYSRGTARTSPPATNCPRRTGCTPTTSTGGTRACLVDHLRRRIAVCHEGALPVVERPEGPLHGNQSEP